MEGLAEHDAATTRRDEDKVFWKDGRPLVPTRHPGDTLPCLDDLSLDEL